MWINHDENVMFVLCGAYGALAIAQAVALFWFNKLKNLAIIKKRYPRYIMVEGGLVIVCLVVAFPLKAQTFFAPKFIVEVPEEVVITIVTPLVHSIMMLECGRQYLIACDLKYLRDSIAQKWKTVIDASYQADNAIVRGQSKSDTKLYVMKNMAVCLFVVTMSTWLAFYTSDNWDLFWTFTTFFSSGYVAFIIELYRKCRYYEKLDDLFYFLWEMRATAITWLVCWLALTITTIIRRGDVIQKLVPVALVMAPSMLSTVAIPLKIRGNPVWNSERVTTRTAEETRLETDVRERRLSAVLKDGALFELFVGHLHKEAGQELAYALIEMVQFKQKYLANRRQSGLEYGDGGEEEKYDDDEDDIVVVVDVDYDEKKDDEAKENEKETVMDNVIDLLNRRQTQVSTTDDYAVDWCPVTAPRSTIVHTPRPGLNEDAIFRITARLLWEKYIRVGAKLELNLDYSTRMHYEELAAADWEVAEDEKVKIFDIVIKEVKRLMSFSFGRMRNKYLAEEAKAANDD